ncbi:hypothetical protein NQ314_020137 [Rhamnusium bicolor]|uniref:Uncharacterized protein n=1 Tax=Rhamnusium bicolor TaxID=1586634 RepID=A0AAV8WLA4_9CUCU|nr:hypothetical protein NQ314_020137 [Rhamnusium bicolor]
MGNKLKDFKRSNFHSLINLRNLYMQNNEISYLNSEDLVQCLPHLRMVFLNGNNFNCDDLLDIFGHLTISRISKGTSVNTSNIYGIACSENENKLDLSTSKSFDNDTKIDEMLRSKLSHLFNSDFTKSVMYNYFNRDFKNSNFF